MAQTQAQKKLYYRQYRLENKEAVKAATQAWRAANPEKVKAYAKAYREANPEKVKASVKAWRAANPEKVKAMQQAWRKANPEKVKAYAEAYRKANPEKVKFSAAKQQAKKRAKTPATPGNIYLAKLDIPNSPTKIGWTDRKFSVRQSEIQKENPFEVKKVFVSKKLNNANKVERTIHDTLKAAGKHIRGEWFDLNTYQIKKLKKQLNSL
jgi:membrane protein involved in colicin uptake